MLINIFGNWINPVNIIAVTATDTSAKIIFSGTNNFSPEFEGKSVEEVAGAINTALAEAKKAASAERSASRGFKGGDRGGRGGDRGGDRGGFRKKFDDRGDRGGRDGGDRGFKKSFDRDSKPARGSDEHREKVKGDFSKRKEGGGKFESKSRKEFTPKKRKDW